MDSYAKKVIIEFKRANKVESIRMAEAQVSVCIDELTKRLRYKHDLFSYMVTHRKLLNLILLTLIFCLVNFYLPDRRTCTYTFMLKVL